MATLSNAGFALAEAHGPVSSKFGFQLAGVPALSQPEPARLRPMSFLLRASVSPVLAGAEILLFSVWSSWHPSRYLLLRVDERVFRPCW